jgi:hypothetical protein
MQTTEDGGPDRLPDLYDLIDERIRAIISEATNGGWTVEDAIIAINDVIAKRWMDASGHPDLPETMSSDFVSDGNEG